MILSSQKLYIKVALAIGLGALIAAVAACLYFYLDAKESKQAEARSQISQLAMTVQSTASVALYVQDGELGREIVEGLEVNDLIAGAQLSTNAGVWVSSAGFAGANEKALLQFDIPHPFFAGEVLGHLKLLPNSRYIDESATKGAVKQAWVLALQSALIALLVSFLVHKTLTAPLNQLTRNFGRISPGEDDPLDIPRYHERDEIGSLVNGINELIGKLNHSIETERTLRERTELLERKFRLIFERASAGICLIDKQNQLLVANEAFERLCGTKSLESKPCLISWFEEETELESFLRELRQNSHLNHVEMELQLRTENAESLKWVHCLFSKVEDSEGVSDLLIEIMMYDITERTYRERMIRFEAEHDLLTQLKNRRAGERLLHEMMRRADQTASPMGLMLIDLDRFKPVNDVYGHEAGDTVLKAIAERLMRLVDDNGVVIRWGGDEFLIGVANVDKDYNLLKTLASNILQQVSKPVMIRGNLNCDVGASIGIAVYPHHGQTLEAMLEAADVAMYDVKEQGRGSYQFGRLPPGAA
ncbi:diguanylate cyclase [Shewanella sp. JM162201]|uniref:Diguanylate cyclase n=1 Tax=Shewanella jiangmenensis TaxID=2837387 RepID=A0ABS5V3H4_9GAMM|nr:sensor domain-containing diguanylate cyclase [Shewanella jiangmenensis]MBT1444244.1 diguanylate cyclase [Shewanella jiangmenensis]